MIRPDVQTYILPKFLVLFRILKPSLSHFFLQFVSVHIEVVANLVQVVEYLIAQQEVDCAHQHWNVIWKMIHLRDYFSDSDEISLPSSV